jgi:hypothetical protein
VVAVWRRCGHQLQFLKLWCDFLDAFATSAISAAIDVVVNVLLFACRLFGPFIIQIRAPTFAIMLF